MLFIMFGPYTALMLLSLHVHIRSLIDTQKLSLNFIAEFERV